MKAKSTVFIFVLIILLLKPQSICAKSDDDYGWILRRIGLTTIELGLFVNYFKYRNTSLHTNEKVASLSIFVFKSDLKATDTQLFTMYYQSAKLSYPTNTIRHSLYDGKTIATGDRSSLKSYRRHLVNSSGAWLGSVVVWDLVTSSNIWGEKYSHSTPVTRAIRSFLLPGWGQKHTGHDLKSAFFFLASVGLAGTSIPPVNRFQKAKLNYRNSNYDFIISSIFINDQSLQRPLYVYQNKERRKDVNRARISSIQNITALGALWLINILDAAIFENVGNEYTSHLTLRPEFNFGSVNMGKNVFPGIYIWYESNVSILNMDVVMKNIGLFILLLVCNCNFSFKSDFDNIGDSIAFVLLEPTSSESGSGFAIADSGSTTCYDDSVSITCTGVSGSYPRQDGDYIDIPKARSFTGPTPHETYTSDYTTKDNVTGLVWKTCSEGQTGSDCTGTATTYTKDSAKTLCSNLNSSNGGNGYANTKSWRLPYLVELNTLVDYGKSSPTIDQTNFPATKSFRYWSLTSLSGSTSSSWTTDFNTGTSKNYSNYDYQNVRCVSNGLQTDNIQSFTDNGDYTITDKATALVWQKCSMGQNSDDTCSGTATTTTWSNALLYCKDLSLAGKTWRLPNINELKSIMNYDKSEPGINQTYFPATQPSLYWSSTTYLITTTYAWNIDFQYGEIDDYGLLKTSGIYVRCVSD